MLCLVWFGQLDKEQDARCLLGPSHATGVVIHGYEREQQEMRAEDDTQQRAPSES
jgi:hypothetical protein